MNKKLNWNRNSNFTNDKETNDETLLKLTSSSELTQAKNYCSFECPYYCP